MSEKFCGKFAVGRIMMKRKKDTYNRVKWRGNNRIIIERSLNDIDILSEDKYAKDDHRTTCSHKSIINERLVTMGQDVLDKPISKQHALVLDGRYTRTSKTLIGGGFRGKNITVPNDTSSFYHMYDAKQVHAVPFSLADQVLITKKETYDLVYFDVCAFFESKYNDGPSLKDVIKTSFERQIYTPNAILALTICTRNASGVDYKGQEQGHALSWVIQQANLHGYTCTPYYDGALHAYPMYVTLFFVLSKNKQTTLEKKLDDALYELKTMNEKLFGNNGVIETMKAEIQEKNIRVPVPQDYDEESETEAVVMDTNFTVGDKVDVLDTRNMWYPSTIIAITSQQIRIHYDGFGKLWDEWISKDSGRFAPHNTHVRGEKETRVVKVDKKNAILKAKFYPDKGRHSCLSKRGRAIRKTVFLNPSGGKKNAAASYE